MSEVVAQRCFEVCSWNFLENIMDGVLILVKVLIGIWKIDSIMVIIQLTKRIVNWRHSQFMCFDYSQRWFFVIFGNPRSLSTWNSALMEAAKRKFFSLPLSPLVIHKKLKNFLNLKYIIIVNVKLFDINPLSANPTKSSNTLKQFVGNLPTNCLRVFDHFMNLALKGLI